MLKRYTVFLDPNADIKSTLLCIGLAQTKV
jgi:hypothetical protein